MFFIDIKGRNQRRYTPVEFLCRTATFALIVPVILFGEVKYHIDGMVRYSYGTMVNDMETLKGDMELKGRKAPLVILGEEPEKPDAKWKLITDFMHQYEYKQAFENTRFTVYLAP